MIFKYLCCGPLRTRVDKASAVFTIPSILLMSIGLILIHYLLFEIGQHFAGTIFIIVMRFLLCLLILVYIVANVLAIFGYAKRIHALYLPYLIIQPIVILIIVAHWIKHLINDIIVMIDISTLEQLVADNPHMTPADKAAANANVISVIRFSAIWAIILTTIGTIVYLAIASFLFIVFFDAWRFIKSDRGDANNRHLPCGVIGNQPTMMGVTQPKI